MNIAGCGTQTAGLAFGGDIPPITGATEEYNGSTWATKSWKFEYSKKRDDRRSWYTNSCFSFWWQMFHQILQEQQKNMMEQVGQQILHSLATARKQLAGCGTQGLQH
jgi:hypothetical protein